MITRKLDKITAVKTPYPVEGNKQILCNVCRVPLLPRKGDEFNLLCISCGELTLISSIRNKPALTEAGDYGNTTITQPQNASRKIRPTNKKPNPIEQEIINRGHTVISSEWIEPTRDR